MVKSNPMDLPTQRLIDQSIAPMFQGSIRSRNHLGVAIAVITPDQTFLFNQGCVSHITELPPNHRTLFELGSLSRLFTTTLLAALVQERMVNLQDSVCNLLPEFSQLAPEITLLRLATHTAGLPNVSESFYQLLFRDAHNPYLTDTLDNLYCYFAHYEADHRRLGHVCYSNLGLGLLGHVLARMLGLSYEQAIVDYICEPLGMVDTRIVTTVEQQQRSAQGYRANSQPVTETNLTASISFGSFHSTSQDLSKFLKASLEQPITPLSQAMSLCQQTHVALGGAKRLGVGLGWFVNHLDYDTGRAAVHWQTGAAAGHQAYLGLINDLHLGVAVLANYERGWQDTLFRRPNVETIGLNLLKTLANAQQKKAKRVIRTTSSVSSYSRIHSD
ncbi:MAG TPA: serine hydrolase domain-containing protein [Crinalium sp.]|jgi:CubicO group peptidase (beta-lactamase class C family)